MTAAQALSALKDTHALIVDVDEDKLKRILAQYATTDVDTLVATYDVTGAALRVLRSLVGSIPVSRSIGGISYTNDSITAAIKELSRGRGGSVNLYREAPAEIIELL
jgi:hypothetical protein